MKDDRKHIVEDAKSQRILHTGSQDECDEWCDKYIKEHPEASLIIRKELKK